MTDVLTKPEFRAFPKLARLNRDIVVSEKIDGTNAAVGVIPVAQADPSELHEAIFDGIVAHIGDDVVWAQSRKRVITPEQDNFGFARWVHENAELLALLGPGYHYGEWWGSGIQRGYGLTGGEKRFSLFNPETVMPPELRALEGLGTVPVLYEGRFNQGAIGAALDTLRRHGSQAEPGFPKPEGVVIYHTAARTSFKVTLEGDGEPKSVREAREKAAA